MPALRTPVNIPSILVLLSEMNIPILNYHMTGEKLIYTVHPLSWPHSFEGVMTFAEGKNFNHVDGGLVLTEAYPTDGPFSHISISSPRMAMALLLNNLFPEWEKDEAKISKGFRVRVGAYTSIGHSGFGWVKYRNSWIRFPHVADVRIGDHTTIGSNVTICRGSLSDTTIGYDSHIDDHVHIAHGVVIGDHVIIAANAMIAGSVTIEDDAWIGPSASIMQGVRIGKGATVGMGAVVLRDVAPGETVVGHHRLIPSKDVQPGVTRPPIPLYDDV